MSWNNNNYRSNGGGYSRGYNSGYSGGYNRSNYGGQRSGGNWSQKPKKHSGCKFGYAQGQQDKPYVRGWKFDKTHGLRAFIAGANKKTKRVKSKNGREWENWTVKATTPHGVQLYNALYDVQKRRVYIQDLGLVMSPNGGAGGYVGPYYRRK